MGLDFGHSSSAGLRESGISDDIFAVNYQLILSLLSTISGTVGLLNAYSLVQGYPTCCGNLPTSRSIVISIVAFGICFKMIVFIIPTLLVKLSLNPDSDAKTTLYNRLGLFTFTNIFVTYLTMGFATMAGADGRMSVAVPLLLDGIFLIGREFILPKNDRTGANVSIALIFIIFCGLSLTGNDTPLMPLCFSGNDWTHCHFDDLSASYATCLGNATITYSNKYGDVAEYCMSDSNYCCTLNKHG